MRILGRSSIPFDMFDLERDALQARRFAKCRRIYDRGQELAWNGDELLKSLIAEHGLSVGAREKKALRRVFAIILWGELAAWKISAQLADELVPLEAKMAATSQAHDEARHFYVMHDYLSALGEVPRSLDRAPEALLELVIQAPHPAHKLLGMQLCVEVIALVLFQTIRQARIEPVLSELLRYFEKDEARHVGLGMQYLPELVRGMTPAEVRSLLFFQLKLLLFSLWESKVIEDDLRTLGCDPLDLVHLTREKQALALSEAFDVLGTGYDLEKLGVLRMLSAAAEFILIPPSKTKGGLGLVPRFSAAWDAFAREVRINPAAFDVHNGHKIRTARGELR